MPIAIVILLGILGSGYAFSELSEITEDLKQTIIFTIIVGGIAYVIVKRR